MAITAIASAWRERAGGGVAHAAAEYLREAQDALIVRALRGARSARRARPRGPRGAGGRGGSGGRGVGAAAGGHEREAADGQRRRRRSGRERGASWHDMVRRPSTLRAMARRLNFHADRPCDCHVERPARRRARGASRLQAPAHAPARARERVVGHGGEALLVLAQREQQVGDAVGRRQVRVRARARTSSARGGRRAHEQRAGLPHEPRRRARRAPARGRCGRAARARRGRRGRRAARARSRSGAARGAPARLDHLGAAVGVELGDRPRVREQDRRRPATSAGSERAAAPPAATSGTVWRDRRRASTRARRAAPAGAGVHRAAASGRPRVSGSTARRGHRSPRRSPARDRAAQDHQLGVERQLGRPAPRAPRPG